MLGSLRGWTNNGTNLFPCWPPSEVMEKADRQRGLEEVGGVGGGHCSMSR